MISKDVHILTDQDLFKLCQDCFHRGESGQDFYFDHNILNKMLEEVKE